MELTMSTLHARERLLTWLALITVAILAWGYLIMHGMHAQMPMNGEMASTGDDGMSVLVTATVMWSVMMVAMMLPSASPMLLTFLRIHHKIKSLTPARFRHCCVLCLALLSECACGFCVAYCTKLSEPQVDEPSQPLNHTDEPL